jgi:hypothetical protein
MMLDDRLKQPQAGLIRPVFIRVYDMNLKSPARVGLPFVCGGFEDNLSKDNARDRFGTKGGNNFFRIYGVI